MIRFVFYHKGEYFRERSKFALSLSKDKETRTTQEKKAALTPGMA